MPTLHACPACATPGGTTVAELDAASRGRFLAFSALKFGGLLDGWLDSVPPVVLRCEVCLHHWYQHQPSAEQLAAMYAAGRPLGAGGEPPLTPTEGMRQEMRRLFALCRHGTGAQLLDFGAGRGRWARAALDAGFQVTAFEPSAPRSAADAAPYELVHSLDQLAGRRFDVVQLEQVLEHVADPLEVLHSVLRHCLPGAVVRITVPNVFRASRAGPLWAQWPYDGRSVHLLAPFEHLHGFSPMSLDRLLARAGLQPVGLAATLRHYPANLLRCLVGPWLPAVSSTLRLVAAPA